MATQMHTLSARVPSEDLEWLASLDMQGASSPSEKLRALITQMRKQHDGSLDHAAGVSWMRELVSPFVTQIRAAENRSRMHSEAVAMIAESLPVLMATLMSERSFPKDAKNRLIEVEDVLVQRSFHLLVALLRLAVTRQPNCYDPEVVARYAGQAIELAELVGTLRKENKDGR